MALLDAMTPRWADDMARITAGVEAVRAAAGALAALDLTDARRAGVNCRATVANIGDFIARYRKCRLDITNSQATFADSEPFLDDTETQIERARRYAEGGDAEYIAALCREGDRSPCSWPAAASDSPHSRRSCARRYAEGARRSPSSGASSTARSRSSGASGRASPRSSVL